MLRVTAFGIFLIGIAIGTIAILYAFGVAGYDCADTLNGTVCGYGR